MPRSRRAKSAATGARQPGLSLSGWARRPLKGVERVAESIPPDDDGGEGQRQYDQVYPAGV